MLCIHVIRNYFSFSFRGGQTARLELINPEIKKKKRKYTNSGILSFISVRYSILTVKYVTSISKRDTDNITYLYSLETSSGSLLNEEGVWPRRNLSNMF